MNKRCRKIYEAAADILLGFVPTKEQITAKEAEFQTIWDGSGQKDYSFYDRDDYAFLALNSWTVRSWSDIEYCWKHELFDMAGPTRSVFDYCGGVGMSACLLSTMFPEAMVTTHNIAPKQRAAAERLAGRLGLENVRVTDEVSGHHDLVIAQETFEHIKRPFPGIQGLLRETGMPAQYLDASSFGLVSPGHHNVFIDDTDFGGVLIPRRKAKRLFNSVLRGLGYERYWKLSGVKSPYNGHPALWERA